MSSRSKRRSSGARCGNSSTASTSSSPRRPGSERPTTWCGPPPCLPTRSEDDPRRPIQAILSDHESPAYFPESQTYYYMSRGEKDGFGRMQVELDRMAVKAADAWPRAMVLVDAEELYEPRIFVRGNP